MGTICLGVTRVAAIVLTVIHFLLPRARSTIGRQE